MKKMEFAKIISTSFLLAMVSCGIKDAKADVSITSDAHMPKVAVAEFDMTDTKMSESAAAAETDMQTATVTINATEKTLYALDDWAKEYISVPKGTDSFQIVVSGATNVSYEVASGDSVTVSAKGVVKPAYETWYWYGNVGSTAKRENEEPTSVESSCNYGDSVVRVTAGAKTFNVKIHVNNYAITYADKVMDDYIAKNIKSNMSDYDKIEQACKMAAGYNYSASASGATGMIVTGGGDCWASTDLIIKFCNKLGIKAWARNGNKDPGAGSGHMNAMAVDGDGTYYELEAGYTGSAPRSYNISRRTSLFSYTYNSSKDGIEIYQYDGEKIPANLVIPNEIGSNKVVGIGKKFVAMESEIKTVKLPDTLVYINESAFNSCTNLTTINLPASLESMGDFTFTNCPKLKNITSAEGCAYKAIDGAIYDKDLTTLYFVPGAESVNLPKTLNKIEEYAFYYNTNIKTVTFPENVTSLGEGAFYQCASLYKIVLNNKLQTIGLAAFASCSSLTRQVIPESVTEIGEYAFDGEESKITICGKNGSAAHTYAKDNNIKFSTNMNTSDDSLYVHKHSYKQTITKADRDNDGTIIKVCEGCGDRKVSTIYAPKTIALSAATYTYNGKQRKPVVTVKDSKGNIIAPANYTVTYTNNINAGNTKTKPTVKVTFKGSKYTGSLSRTFTINKATNKLTGAAAYTKTASAKAQSFKLNMEATGGKVTYKSDNKNVKIDSTGKVTIAKNFSGKAVITVTAGNNNYKTATKKVTITVKPAAVTLKSVKNTTVKNASKGKLTVTWNKLSYATGYQIQYSANSSFKSGNKTVNVKGASAVSKAITGLAKNKTYYVRIRTYKTIAGKNVFSAWSAKKSVKIAP